MKKTKKAKSGAKQKKGPMGASAMRDLELLDPAAKRIKGGRLASDPKIRATR